MASRKLYPVDEAADVFASGSSDESSHEVSSSDEFSQSEGPMSSSITPVVSNSNKFHWILHSIRFFRQEHSKGYNLVSEKKYALHSSIPRYAGLQCDLQVSNVPFKIFHRFPPSSLIEGITRETIFMPIYGFLMNQTVADMMSPGKTILLTKCKRFLHCAFRWDLPQKFQKNPLCVPPCFKIFQTEPCF